jgi:hypothetical protein
VPMTPAEALARLRRVLPTLIARRDSLIAAIGSDYKRDEIDELIDAASVIEQSMAEAQKWADSLAHEERDPFPSVRSQALQAVVRDGVLVWDPNDPVNKQ